MSAMQAAALDQTRATMTAYLEALGGGGKYGGYLTPDATLTMMGSGEVTCGRDAIVALIDFMHTEAFAARPELRTLAVDGERAMIEAVFVGAHIGEFAGIPPTGRAVRVPYTVAYDLAGDAISALHVYLSLDALVRQLRAA